VPIGITFEAFWMGVRFDTVISGYILIFPFLWAIAVEIFKFKQNWLRKLTFPYVFVCYTACFALCAADIPFYGYFNSRLTISILNWVSTPDIMFEMLVESPSYYPFIAMALGLSVLYFILLRKVYSKWYGSSNFDKVKTGKINLAVSSVLFALFLFIGIRGRVEEKSPIRWGTAYFSIYPFPNQLGLNPVFTFIQSWLHKNENNFTSDNFMDSAEAISVIRNDLNIPSDAGFDSPLARTIPETGEQKKMNIIIVIMESMSSGYMGNSGLFKPTLTPFLDSLSEVSIFFPNCFSAGIHTFNGLAGVFLSIPSLPEEGNMFDNVYFMQPFSGIGTTLSALGYSTLFACPHDEQFDNIGGIMRNNGFERVLSQQNFIDALVSSPWGIADHQLFERTLPSIDELASTGKPFLAALLTTSNHGPWVIPEPKPDGFEPHSSEKHLKTVEYADWSIRYLIENARKRSWFNNTIFVFISDHGAKLESNYLLDINYNRIPLIIFAPGMVKAPIKSEALAQQADVFPTLMGLLGLGFVNNTFGIDLLKEKRSAAVFCSDKSSAAVDSTFFLIRIENTNYGLYRWREKAVENHLISEGVIADRLEKHAKALFQVLVDMVINKKTGVQKRQ
jgi:phosphoglycerol transferase MdoB-like AlkP superfamily enzyme